MVKNKKEKKPKIKNTMNKLNSAEIFHISKDSNLFAKLLRENPGFVESAVLSVIQKNRSHPEFDDLMQVGRMSLWKATDKYSPDKTNGSKFGTFAFKVIQNGVRQELKKVNRLQKDHISLEHVRHYNGSAMEGEYKEIKFKETVQIRQLRNFEEGILNEIVLKEQFQKLNVFEQQVFDLKFVNSYSLQKVADTLDISMTYLKKWYYVQGGKNKLESVRASLNA